MYRADHYEKADSLLAKVLRQLAGPDWRDEDLPVMALEIAAAQVHATLAAAGPGVEAEVKEHEKSVARALGAAEGSQRARQAARPPLLNVRPGVVAERGTVDPTDIPLADLDALAESIRPATTCRCTGLPHDLGSPGCEQPEARLFPIDPRQEGKTARSREAARTVRPKPGPPKGGRQ